MSQGAEQNPAPQSGSLTNALTGLGIKTLFAFAKAVTKADLWCNLGQAVTEFLKDYMGARTHERGQEFFTRVAGAQGAARQALDDPDLPDPLKDAFVAVFRGCLQDDENEKVRYYAAFMCGYAEVGPKNLSKAKAMGILSALKSLRVHDLRMLFLLHSTRTVSHATEVSVDEIKDHHKSHGKEEIDWDLLDQSLASLVAQGLVKQNLRAVTAPVPLAAKYALDNLGKTICKMMGPHLDPAPTLRNFSS